MAKINHYLKKSTLFPPQIPTVPPADLGIIVVIPCYDEPNLLTTLNSLKNCHTPKCSVEIIIHINSSTTASERVKKQNQHTLQQTQRWIIQHDRPKLQFYTLYHPDLPPKHAGVGLARKIGMDEAAYRFERIGQKKGIIVCFDADSLCQPNYLTAIEQHFENYPKSPACNIHFEHPIEGTAFSPVIYQAIIQYELHLRYYIHAQRWAGFPFAYQTIGSSMAVRCDAYQRQGGMNRRKAGEDFYFIQKFIPLGHFTRITTTTVVPSPRLSHRVPFGTGKAIADQIQKNNASYLTYHPKSFQDLKQFFQAVPQWYQLPTQQFQTHFNAFPQSVQRFLQQYNFFQKIIEIQTHTTTLSTFTHRFFLWFNAFMVMKYVHFARDDFYTNIPIHQAALWLLQTYYVHTSLVDTTSKDLLLKMRIIDTRLDGF